MSQIHANCMVVANASLLYRSRALCKRIFYTQWQLNAIVLQCHMDYIWSLLFYHFYFYLLKRFAFLLFGFFLHWTVFFSVDRSFYSRYCFKSFRLITLLYGHQTGIRCVYTKFLVDFFFLNKKSFDSPTFSLCLLY